VSENVLKFETDEIIEIEIIAKNVNFCIYSRYFERVLSESLEFFMTRFLDIFE
jgi:hypothetical protein